MFPEKFGKPLDRREFLGVGGAIVGGLGNVGEAALLAADFKVVWDLDKACLETTATRERSFRSRIARWTMNRASDVRDQRAGGARRRSCQFARCMSPFCR